MKVVYPASTIAATVQRLGSAINHDFAEHTEPLVVLVVLKGAMIFAADLLRTLTIPCVVHCVTASSYRDQTTPGALQVGGLDALPLGQTVLLIEDIVDTGQTVAALTQALQSKQSTVYICTLLDKPHRRRVPVEIHYRGFLLEADHFIVGYGLDFNERYRELPYIADLGLA
jgi:hypoxanthine phosphoribosyltransferase